MIYILIEIYEAENRETTEKTNETKYCFSEKIKLENLELDWQSKKTKKLSKPGRGKAILKGYILYDSIYTMFSKWQNYSNKE